MRDLGGCHECYRIDARPGRDDAWIVHASDVLGAQYGVTHVFELLGFRFRHPFDTYVPPVPAPGPETADVVGTLYTPDKSRRGLHLHTLHPIEAYYALWTPEPGLERARRIYDWIIKNRGNYFQYVALDDILEPTRHDAWRDQTAELLASAHRRGLQVGIGFQLFAQGSLQHGLYLVQDAEQPVAPQIAARLALITDGLPFDTYELSFGEFFGAGPDQFIATLDETYRQLAALRPQARLDAVIHVGDSPEQRVTYRGETMIYYFLVKFADPRIVPQVHTVMYYNLFEDAGGAYHHEDFREHRAFLFDRLRTGLPVAYKPETAYWVAFDNSVPMYLPLYMRSRWLDLDRIRAHAVAEGHRDLDEHVLFSTGWEWGYWQHDVAALRASYSLPARWSDQLAEQLAPDAKALVGPVIALTELQHHALLEQRLAAYQSGRDALIDVGEESGIIAAPGRIDVDDVAGLGAELPAFRAGVIAGLGDYATRVAAVAAALPAADGPWAAEIIDGIEIDAARARFIPAIYAAVARAAAGEAGAEDALAEAEAALLAGRVIVARRHGALHDRDRRLREDNGNVTNYGYGYLRYAEDLCFWQREWVMAANAVRQQSGIGSSLELARERHLVPVPDPVSPSPRLPVSRSPGLPVSPRPAPYRPTRTARSSSSVPWWWYSNSTGPTPHASRTVTSSAIDGHTSSSSAGRAPSPATTRRSTPSSRASRPRSSQRCPSASSRVPVTSITIGRAIASDHGAGHALSVNRPPPPRTSTTTSRAPRFAPSSSSQRRSIDQRQR